MFVYIKSEPGLYTVGHYAPNGQFISESDHPNTTAASKRAAYLNGQNFREEEDKREEFIEKTRRLVLDALDETVPDKKGWRDGDLTDLFKALDKIAEKNYNRLQ